MAGRAFSKSLAVTAVTLLLGIAGCVDTAPTVLELTPELGLPAGVGLAEDQFAIPAPRVGDVHVSDIVYQQEEGDFKSDIRARERITVVAEETYVDGYGVPRQTYHLNATYIEPTNGTEVYWEEYWVDLATGETIGWLTPADGGRQTYRNSLGAGGVTLYESRATFTAAGPSKGNYRYPDYLMTPGLHGAFAHGQVLPKQGTLKRFNAAWDFEFEIQFKPVATPANAAQLNLTQGDLETYEAAIKAVTKPFPIEVDFAAIITPSSPYPVMAHETLTGKSSNGTTLWRSHYSFTVTEITRGSTPVQLKLGPIVEAPAVSGSELTDTFPGLPAGLVTISPLQAKEAGLKDAEVAAWFAANPKAFLSYYFHEWGDGHHLVGAMYNHLTEEQYKSVQLAICYLEWTNPDDGKSLGFLVTAWIAHGQAQPAMYEKYPALDLDPTEPNFYEFTRAQWIQKRSNVVGMDRALAFFQETAGPHAGKKPGFVEWWTYGNSQGGGSGYFLGYNTQPTTSDASSLVGVGFTSGWTLHGVGLSGDGLRFFEGTWTATWEQSQTVAGVRLPT